MATSKTTNRRTRTSLLKVSLAIMLVISNLLLGFPVDFITQKLNDSRVVDNLYRSDKQLPSMVGNASAANFSMRSGTYMGTGAAKTISGLGFQPDTVLVKSSTAAGVMVFKTSAMPANTTAFTSATADNTATSISFTSTGFTLGTLANVNTANVLYHWVAFTGSDCTATGNYCVGTYTGNAAASRAITTGFQPSYAMVKRSTAVEGNFRIANEPTNETLFFGTTARITGATTHIPSFAATSFTVGATNNASGGIYYYIAFKATAGAVSVGTYTGDGVDNRGITSTGFLPDFVMVKNATSATAANRNPIMNTTESYGDNSLYVGSATANLVNGIQALQSDGFQIGTAVQANESAATFYWVAFGGASDFAADGSSFKMTRGSYTGNATARSITGLGFQPDLVIIKDNAANYAVFRTGLMAGNTTAYMSNAVANFTAGITSLDADGFSLGTSTILNTTSNTYQWQAFGGAFNPYTNTGASDFAIGAYYGNGIDSRNIGGVPFQPNMVTVKRSGASAGVWRSSAMAGDLTAFFGATAEAANNIQTLATNGFQTGTAANVNTAANVYHWFAFKTGTNFAVGSYSGTGAAQNITTPGFQPDLAWVKRSTAVNGVHRGSSLAGDATQYFANTANVTARITAFVSSGFSVTGTSTETNASGGTYRYATWKIPSTGVLSFDIVDGAGASVSSPTYAMPATGFSFGCANTTGSLGTTSQRLRVNNSTANPAWSLSIAATGGATSSWANSGNTRFFDFNESTGAPSGCSDGGDADSLAGRLTLTPSGATNTPQGGCSASNISFGSTAGFQQGVTDSVTLATASSSANTNCYWDLTDIGVSQYIPSEQLSDTYTINLTLTVTAL
jgi:hypothetical protein